MIVSQLKAGSLGGGAWRIYSAHKGAKIEVIIVVMLLGIANSTIEILMCYNVAIYDPLGFTCDDLRKRRMYTLPREAATARQSLVWCPVVTVTL